MSTQRKTTKRRAKPKGTVRGNEWNILKLYIRQGKDTKEIGALLDIAPKNVTLFLNNMLKDFKQVHETNLLVKSQAKDMNTSYGNVTQWKGLQGLRTDTSEEFLKLLSGPNDPALTEHERQFAFLLVYDGDTIQAVIDSGLDAGLTKSNNEAIYKRNVEVRGAMLKSKPNVRELMQKLQIKFVEDMDLSRETMQAEIMRTVQILRNQDATKNAPTIAKLLNDLGRTKGIFIDKVETTKVDLKGSFDQMLQMRKERGIDGPRDILKEGYAKPAQVIEGGSRNVDDRQSSALKKEPETWVHP